MNKKIGYLTFGRDDFGYGLHAVLSGLDAPVYRVTPKTAPLVDILVLSVFWWEHVYLLADFMRKSGIVKERDERPFVIIGGFNSFNPAPMGSYADAVVVGDGEGALADLIENPEASASWIYREGQTTPVIYRSVSRIAPTPHITNGIARIEIARGCKYRCAFCAVAHHKPYRECAYTDIERVLSSVSVNRISLFAPEPTLHRDEKRLQDLCLRMGKTRMDSDVRLDRLSKIPETGRNVPRIGLEGLSERLRKSVNKPYSDRFILKQVEGLIRSGHSGLFLYLILDLPEETPDDWECFRELLKRIGRIPGADRFVLKPSPSVFMPTPGTPLEGESIHASRDYRRIWTEFFNRDGRTWDVTMAERTRVFTPAMRILSMLATRGGEEFHSVEKELTTKKIIRISAGRVQCISMDGLLTVLENYGGVERWCGRIEKSDAPWRQVRFLSDPDTGPGFPPEET